MAHIRTFVAVKVPQRVKSNMGRVIQKLAATGAGYKWVEEENLHVTLNFVGDVVDVEVPEFCKLVKDAIQDCSPFDMAIQGVSAFPRPEQPRTIWIGVDEGTEALTELNRRIAEVMSHWGINKDRNEYVPHMTLGRVQRGGRWNEKTMEAMHRLRNHDGGTCHVDQVVVYSSYLDKTGPTHTPMSTIRLS